MHKLLPFFLFSLLGCKYQTDHYDYCYLKIDTNSSSCVDLMGHNKIVNGDVRLGVSCYEINRISEMEELANSLKCPLREPK